MPENEKLVNTHWLVGIAGAAEPLVVWAAYIHQQTVHDIRSGALPVVLKDADHKIVFQGHVQYVRRAQPGMALDRETGRYSPPAEGSATAQTIHYTAYTPLPGAAGGGPPQTFTVNLPTDGAR